MHDAEPFINLSLAECYAKLYLPHSLMKKNRLNLGIFCLAMAGFIMLLNACSTDPVHALGNSPFYDSADKKLWKHRVNCVSNADSLSQGFPGVEIDIYYIDSTSSFIATHGEPCAGGSLQEVISSISDYKTKYFWLDFKNSEDSLTVVKAIPLLNELFDTLSISAHCIVESKNPACIDSLESHNMFSSYWVPHHYDFEPWYSDDDLKPLISEVLEHHNPTVLSANYTMAPFLASKFSDQFLHIWTNGLISEKDKDIINDLKKYPNIKVILVDYDSPF